MISSKKLINMAGKWHKVASKGRNRISLPNHHENVNADSCSTSYVADKGHFVVYSADQRRFVLPLAYLHNNIFRELLEMSAEEFGISSGGSIRLPCDSICLNYVVLLIQRGVAKDLENVLLNSIATYGCSSSASYHCDPPQQQLLIPGCWIGHDTRIMYRNWFWLVFVVWKRQSFVSKLMNLWYFPY